jgi:large subunit ribosomal protein L6
MQLITNQIEIKEKKIKFVFLNQKKFLIFTINSVNYYIELERNFHILKESNNFIKCLHESCEAKLISYLKSVEKASSRILHLKGLGLKAFNFKADRILELKLGFSHIVRIVYDSDVYVRVKKNFIFIQSINRQKVGNLAAKIKNLKKPDSYKGKGIWYKNENLKLKVIKKK